MSPLPDLDLASLRAAYAQGLTTPSDVVRAIYPALQASGPAFIHILPLDALLARCAELEAQPAAAARGDLWGVPFGVKDNIDVAGLPTTAACPEFVYTPERGCPSVDALLDAGVCLLFVSLFL